SADRPGCTPWRFGPAIAEHGWAEEGLLRTDMCRLERIAVTYLCRTRTIHRRETSSSLEKDGRCATSRREKSRAPSGLVAISEARLFSPGQESCFAESVRNTPSRIASWRTLTTARRIHDPLLLQHGTFTA